VKKILSGLVGSWAHPIKQWKWILSELVVIAAVVLGLNVMTGKKAAPAPTQAPAAAAVVDTSAAVVDSAAVVKEPAGATGKK
jgi:hypothetical protein